MQTITLYRYNRPDGGVSVSPVKPDTDYAVLYRLVADEGMVLTDGKSFTSCTDTPAPELWYEVADLEEGDGEASELKDALRALAILGCEPEEEGSE